MIASLKVRYYFVGRSEFVHAGSGDMDEEEVGHDEVEAEADTAGVGENSLP